MKERKKERKNIKVNKKENIDGLMKRKKERNESIN